MKLIVGLGNPGEEYKNNRHNVGFVVVDEIAANESSGNWNHSKNANALFFHLKRDGGEIELLKPQTYMNDSGLSVVYAVKKHDIPIPDVYVIHDDLDIDLGKFKIQKGKGPKDHKGLLSIYEKLKSKDFWHVRIGIENRKQATDYRLQTTAMPGEKYVLQNFEEAEMNIIKRSIQQVVCKLIKELKI